MGDENDRKESQPRRYSGSSSDGDGGGYGNRDDRIWSDATSGRGGDFLYGHGGSSENAVRRISSNKPGSPLKNSLLAPVDEVYLGNNQDLVE